jgi:hypothetical protein
MPYQYLKYTQIEHKPCLIYGLINIGGQWLGHVKSCSRLCKEKVFYITEI